MARRPPGSGITLRHLAEHTSGLPPVPPGTTNINPYKKFSDDRLRVLLAAGLDRLTTAPAGKREEYSNFGYAVLGGSPHGGRRPGLQRSCRHARPLSTRPATRSDDRAPAGTQPITRERVVRECSVTPWDMTGAILPAGGLWATPRTVARVLTGLVLDRTLGKLSLAGNEPDRCR